MLKECISVEPQVQGLPSIDLRGLCWLLFNENEDYNKLSSDEVYEAGTHTSLVIHDLPGGVGKWASLHFRRNLNHLNNFELSVEKAIDFLKKIREDLNKLARDLKRETRLKNVKMIFGLTTLSAAWGRRHGFDISHFTNDPELIRRHFASMPDITPPVDGSKSLTLFSITPDRFIEKFKLRVFGAIKIAP